VSGDFTLKSSDGHEWLVEAIALQDVPLNLLKKPFEQHLLKKQHDGGERAVWMKSLIRTAKPSLIFGFMMLSFLIASHFQSNGRDRC